MLINFSLELVRQKYMGSIISEKGVKPDESHIWAINEFDKLTNKKDVETSQNGKFFIQIYNKCVKSNCTQ